MKKLRVVKGKSNRKSLVRIDRDQAENGEFCWPDGSPIDSEHMLISLLLPAAASGTHVPASMCAGASRAARYTSAGKRWR
jgi:hypothetical protein